MPKKKPTEPPKSSVIQLLDIVYDASLKSTGHSWGRLNTALQTALQTAIGSGFEFADDDWAYIGSHYRSGYWLGDDVERWYSRCVADGNMSAITSYEKWKNREPYIADDVTPTESKFAHMTGDRQTCRLAVDFKFMWKGVKVTVNSFGNGYLNAASYEESNAEPTPSAKLQKAIDTCEAADYQVYYRNWPENRKPLKRFKITRQDILDDRAERKRRKPAVDGLAEYYNDVDQTAQIKKMLGITTKEAFDALPVETLEAVLEQCRSLWPQLTVIVHDEVIPIAEFRKAWNVVLQCRKTKTAWSNYNNGSLPVGSCNIHNISTEGDVKVGCKIIKYAFLAKIAKTLPKEG